MTDEFWKIMTGLSEKFCERKALKCLFRFLPAYYAPNGLMDGWEGCRKALADTRALCRDELTPDEEENIHKAMNIIDRMLAGQ